LLLFLLLLLLLLGLLLARLLNGQFCCLLSIRRLLRRHAGLQVKPRD
jgi:hypothetical protein